MFVAQQITVRFATHARAPLVCVSCGAHLDVVSRTAGRLFCAECLERGHAHDATDPYDELGGGD